MISAFYSESTVLRGRLRELERQGEQAEIRR